MLNFAAFAFVGFVGHLQRAVCELGLHPDEELAFQTLRDCLASAEAELKLLPFSAIIFDDLALLKHMAANRDPSAGYHARLLTHLNQLGRHVQIELNEHLYLLIDKTRRGFYEQKKPLFGSAVDAAFPDASADIADAGRCYAVDQPTACVFHLMRVLEHALRNLSARHLGKQMEFEDWGTVIGQLEKKIEMMPKGSEKQELGEALGELRIAKNAWRNHVSHSRVSYDDREAATVYGAVLALMLRLASHPPPSTHP